MKRFPLLLSLLLVPALAHCEPAATDKPAAEEKGPKVALDTSLGEIVIQLNEEKAPATSANFLSYVKKGHYDGTVFHRVIEDFMIQGGGFAVTEGKLVEKPTGEGIKNESNNGLGNVRGSVAMARTADPNSATAQFFINVRDNAMLNYPNGGGYAVFGKVVKGMDVVDKIKAVATGSSQITMLDPSGAQMTVPSDDVPKENVVIKTAKVAE